MTRENEIYNKETYGTEYPVCGNCENIREIAGRPWCRLYNTYRDFDSCKCADYKYERFFKLLLEE